MSERIAAHKRRLAEAREKLNQALDSIGDKAEAQIYSDGAQWTLRQLAIHLAIADRGQNNIIRSCAEGKELIPADYDVDRYNKRSVEKQAEMTLQQARDSLALSRQELLAWLDNLPDESVLDKTGRHATLQILTISQMLDVVAGHEAGHAKDIVAMLAQYS